MNQPGLPMLWAASTAAKGLPAALRRWGHPPSRHILIVSVARQRMWLWEPSPCDSAGGRWPAFRVVRQFLISTSAWGMGQVVHSQRTPLGLHRVARKIGGGQLPGTVFRNRRVVGLTWQGRPNAKIVHRILWLEGLEPGFNRHGHVDTFRRYIYIHGVGDETTLGRPCSHGCIHLAGADLIPLHARVAEGTLVWISAY